MARNQMQRMMKGAFVLTLASFIAKLLSAVYRVPFQNLVGDEGFYVYQQVYPIYGLAMTLALSGLPQFISKLVASQKNPQKQQQTLDEIYPLVFWFSICLWGLTFFFSGVIATIMGNSLLKPLIQVVSFTFLLVPPLSFYRGNFQGNLLMVPSAFSQVSEQFLRVGVILAAASAFHRLSLTIYQVGTLAMTGAFVGGVVAWLILMYYDHKIFGTKQRFLRIPQTFSVSQRMRRKFFVEGGLLSIYSGLLILFQLVDSFFIVNALEFQGVAEQSARIAKGVYDRGQPLVQLGLVAATALSATFLPALTACLMEERGEQFMKSAKIYLRLTIGLALAASTGLAVLLPYINYALFKDNAGNMALTLFVFAIVLTATIQAYQSIAQSQNYFRRSLKAAGWGIGVKFVITGPLTVLFGTIGASLSTLVGLTVILWYLIKKEDAQVNVFWGERHFGRKLITCAVGMASGLWFFYELLTYVISAPDSRLQALLFSLSGVVVGGTIFIQLAIRLELLTLREWLMIPFGKKILRFMGGK